MTSTQKAGSRSRRISVQVSANGHDGAGQPIKVWSTIAQVWANVKSQTGMGAIAGEQNGVATSVTRYSFRIRYRQGIDAGMRVLMGGVSYDITSVQMDEAGREWTDLVSNRGANDG